MSDNESTSESPVKADKKVVFTEKEEMVLKAAWRCLKSGPPEAAAKGKKATATPTPSKKRTKKDVENEDGDEDDEGRTLVNKRNKSSAVKKIVKTEDSDDAD
ncbi:unnamed protein product [Aureobasidium mustum]|uniref:Uncharacterized protein n=1 Tax=Aureobasidium mustum TaxID=2773714 RepID=A0A9N8K1C2_9PEZI|nr:unnamed protein product [Aureobasidium mustum]